VDRQRELVGVTTARLRHYDAAACATASPGAQGAEGESHAGDGQGASADGSTDGLAHRVVTELLEERVEIFDPVACELRLTVSDLGEERERIRAEVENLLSLRRR
jgi:hypothetical protein